MFKIQIKEDLKYSAKKKGAFCQHGPLCLEIHPCRLLIKDLRSSKTYTLNFFPKTAFSEFSFFHDLQRLKTEVFAKNRQGLFHYSLCEKGLCMHKLPPIELESPFYQGPLEKKQIIPLPEELCLAAKKEPERLFLGSHKLAKLTSLQEKKDLKQILPFWLYLAQEIVPEKNALVSGGVFALLEELKKQLKAKEHDNLGDSLQELFLASFQDLFVPRLLDNEWQGFSLPALQGQEKPLQWIVESAKVLRALFFQEEGLEILPHLPKQLHCGRFIGLQSPELLTLDIEWTKKKIRRLFFVPKNDCELCFSFQRDLRSFRLRSLDFEKKRIKCGETLACQKGKGYFLDNFEK